MPTDLTAEDVIALLDLAPLAGEGGFFRQTWIRPAEAAVEREPDGTCIYYLVTPDSFSALHRLRHDEIFHFYLGDPCRMSLIAPDGTVREVTLGHDLRAGMQVQQIVPAGHWQATRLVEGGRFALLGTTMTPGFHPSGFELAQAEVLADLDPSIRAAVAPLIATP